MRPLVLLALAVTACAASAEDVVAAAEASLTEVQRDEPGSSARAEAITAAIEGAGDLSAVDRLTVQAALAEAWLDAGKPALCLEVATAVQAAATATPALRERAALARAAAARALIRAGEAPAGTAALAALATAGDAGPRAAAHLRIAQAELGMALDAERKPSDIPGALGHLDAALELLRAQPAAERVPVYLLRLTVMERGGAKPAEVLEWLQARAGDPAAAEVAATAVTTQDKLLGQPAPDLVAPRLDVPGEVIDLAKLRGRPVLIDFFATWCKPCAAIAPAVTRFAQQHPEVQILGLSLDNAQTIADLPAFIAAHAVTWPIIGEKVGWDGEIDDVWGINAIPSLVLIAADGSMAANDLVGGTVEETLEKLVAAAKALEAPAKPAKPAKPVLSEPAFP
jgi:cytochrome c biogenesis protein CcmG/thiol:disulfide interchange protein DsbE